MGRPGEFLHQVGVPKAKPGPAALREIGRRCGKDYLREFQAALEHAESLAEQGAGGEAALQNLYPLMYRDADTAIATHAFSSDVTVAWLRWTDARMPEQGRLLDLGCGIGLISCWHAQHSPDLEVVGVDRDPNAVEVARELAERLDVSNVTFEVGDYTDGGQPWGTFDHAICVTVAYSDVDDFCSLADRFGTPRGMADKADSFRGDAARALGQALVPDGQLWSLERLPDRLTTMQWWYQLQNAGLCVDPMSSRLDVGSWERMPLTLAKKTPKATDPVELAELAARIFDRSRDVDEPLGC